MKLNNRTKSYLSKKDFLLILKESPFLKCLLYKNYSYIIRHRFRQIFIVDVRYTMKSVKGVFKKGDKNMIVDQLVNKHYDRLNENDLYIWNYISNHKKECESLSIIELAQRCNVSRTTILRFTKKLSLEGYGEFKAYLKLDNKEKYKSISNVDKVCNAYSTVINGIKKKDCTEIFKLIDSSRNIYVYGEGMIQSSIKRELKRNFLLGGKILYDFSGRDELEIIEDMATDKDLFIMISVSGENEYILEFSKSLKIKNIPIISITKSNCNSLAQMSNYNLYVSSVSFPQPLSKLEYQSLTSYFILIEILLLKYIEYREALEERGN